MSSEFCGVMSIESFDLTGASTRYAETLDFCEFISCWIDKCAYETNKFYRQARPWLGDRVRG